MSKNRRPTVIVPADICKNKDLESIHGYFHESSNVYNVINTYDTGKDSNVVKLAAIGARREDAVPGVGGLRVWRENGKLQFYQNEKRCKQKEYDFTQNLFSRNSGILESELMLEKCAVISGVGSVGSLVALELARSGLGNFILIDNEVLEYHNLCRHQCGLHDVGKYKVEAVKERIIDINPKASVRVYPGVLEHTPAEIFEGSLMKDSIFIGCADNREGDLFANTLSNYFGIPFVSIGFWERAAAGEIFYSIPGVTPCYECLFGRAGKVVSARVNTNRRFYTNQDHLVQTNFEPGISVDISFVTTVGIKLVLDLLNHNDTNYTQRLLPSLSQYTLVCNTNNSKLGGDLVEIFTEPLQITRSIHVDYSKDCNCCKNLLKEGKGA